MRVVLGVSDPNRGDQSRNGEQDRDHFGPLPLVTLRGAWLRKFGFEVGVHVRIEATPGQILLRPLWNDDPPVRENVEKPVVRYVEVEDR